MICEHNHPGEVLSFDLCEFMTYGKVCLNIYISKRHKDINEKLFVHYAEAYGERDHMGTNDSVDNIKTSNLSLEDKQLETDRAKGARMNAFLEDGWKMWEVQRSILSWSS